MKYAGCCNGKKRNRGRKNEVNKERERKRETEKVSQR
jgi:hypothetical protein